LIATGALPQRLERWIKGNEIPRSNVHVLRNIDEAHALASEVAGKDIVIVGSSFIGMETASIVVDKAKSVSVVGMETVPFERVLGKEVGAVMQKLHEGKGVKFYMEAQCDEFKVDEHGNVHTVTLKDKTALPCSLVILGAGITPCTGYLRKQSESGEKDLVVLAGDGSVIVDETLATGAPGVYAAGDLARFPLPLLDGKLVRIEHWGVAMTQGKIAAKNMLGKKKPFKSVPFFWTSQYGKCEICWSRYRC